MVWKVVRNHYKIKELRYKDSVYKIDPLLFNVYMLLVVIFVYWIFAHNNFDKSEKVYLNCPDNSFKPCENPFYNNPSVCGKKISLSDPICSKPYLEVGESYGSPPPFYVAYFGWLVSLGVLVVFVINHLLYNLGFKFKVFFNSLESDEEVKEK